MRPHNANFKRVFSSYATVRVRPISVLQPAAADMQRIRITNRRAAPLVGHLAISGGVSWSSGGNKKLSE